MERDFYNNEFEELIKQKADQYKLYPSDKVWKRIYDSLHTGRRWFITGMALLITGIFFIAGKELIFRDPHNGSLVKKQTIAAAQQPEITEADNKANTSTPAFPVFSTENNTARAHGNENNKEASAQSNDQLIAYDFPDQTAPANNNDILIADNNTTITASEKINFEKVPGSKSFIIENYPADNNTKTVSDNNLTTTANSTAVKPTENAAAIAELNKINWLQENARYQLPKIIKKGRLQLLEYLSPTASYRTLSGGGNYTVPSTNVQNIPIALSHVGSPNDYVDHKPAMGFEFGANVVYRLTRNLSIRTGLQFDYSRYTIEAYSTYIPQPATITLNSVYGYTQNAITSYTNVQNFGGKSRETLQNQYFQLAAPVGLEVKILGNDKLQFSLAATVQPTYLLNRNSYLLATDYTNYVKAPTLFRRWNIDGGVEAFVSYKISGLRFQLGPEFRYQLLSTFSSSYPIKENLKEYGIKIGISKDIW